MTLEVSSDSLPPAIAQGYDAMSHTVSINIYCILQEGFDLVEFNQWIFMNSTIEQFRKSKTLSLFVNKIFVSASCSFSIIQVAVVCTY